MFNTGSTVHIMYAKHMFVSNTSHMHGVEVCLHEMPLELKETEHLLEFVSRVASTKHIYIKISFHNANCSHACIMEGRRTYCVFSPFVSLWWWKASQECTSIGIILW